MRGLVGGRVLSGTVALVNPVLQDLRRNRWLAAASLVAGVVLWTLIQDVENPRLEAVVPSDAYQPIPVEPVNLPDGLVLQDSLSVRVRVKASADDVPALTADDFTATIDVGELGAGETASRPVKVESKRSGVRVVAVQPRSFLITPERAATREFPISVNVRGELPAGFRVTDGTVPSAEPSTATVTGRAELVDTVAKVEIELNVTGVREETYRSEGELQAKTAGGNRVNVTIQPARARATVAIEQVVAQRTVAIQPAITGEPADGYRITRIAIEPRVLTATGPTPVIDGLDEFTLERTDISGARTTVTQTKQIVAIPNVSTDVRTVVLTIGIEPIRCGSVGVDPCGATTIVVAPTFGSPPPGLTLGEGAISVTVRLSGPLAELARLTPKDVAVVVPLTDVKEGFNFIQPTAEVTLPQTSGVVIEAISGVRVRMVPTSPPTSTQSLTQTPTPRASQ